MVKKVQPVLLVIRDGWGINSNLDHDSFNAIKRASTPCADSLSEEWPNTQILTCGLDVGLPEGIMGNSEVGHQNIGAGRIVDQEIVRINKAFSIGAVSDNTVLKAAFERVQQSEGRANCHIMGLVSDAGVHSMLDHLYGLLELAKAQDLPEVYIHAFTDGRDTPPQSGIRYIRELEAQCRKIGIGKVASVCGRFWSMDRDLRWERVQKAYECLTGCKVERTALSAEAAIQNYYDHPLDSSRQGDEFIYPTAILDGKGRPISFVKDGDALIFFNFRGDRPREITRAFIDTEFSGFKRKKKLDLFYATMTEYQKGLCPNVVFPKPPKMDNILGAYIAEQGISQFRCAETEKYPHVTFFFNDYRDEPFKAEDRVLVPSPKEVTTYDQKPEMSAYEVSAATQKAILSNQYGLIIVNFANPDMVGHTGSIKAAVQACSIVDSCVEELLEAVDEKGFRAIITADHGNAEQMFDPLLKAPHTAHTVNPVELVVYGKGCQEMQLRSGGRLADIAPTVLDLMGLPQPKEMTGQSLIIPIFNAYPPRLKCFNRTV